MSEEWVLQCSGNVTPRNSSIRLPAIMVVYDPVWAGSDELRALLSGIEEEQVPAVYCQRRGGGVALASDGAKASVVGVGVSLGADGWAALHHNRLPKERPLLLVDLPCPFDECRLMGANAARLVKGIPLQLPQRSRLVKGRG